MFFAICTFTTSLFFCLFLAPEWRGYWHVLRGRQLRPRLYLCFGQIHMHSNWCVGKSNFPALISMRSCSSTFPMSLERWQLCKWLVMSSLHSTNLRTTNSQPRKSPQLDFRNSENEHFVSIASLLVSSHKETGNKITCCKHKMAAAFLVIILPILSLDLPRSTIWFVVTVALKCIYELFKGTLSGLEQHHCQQYREQRRYSVVMWPSRSIVCWWGT